MRRKEMKTDTNQLTGPIKPGADLHSKDLPLATTPNQIRVSRRTLYPIFALCFLMLLASVSRAETYQIISTVDSVVGGDLSKTVMTVQVGNNPINRYTITRVRKAVPTHVIKDTLVLLPPLGSGFQNYEVGEDGDYNNSFVAFFARRNFDVWGLSQRAGLLVAGSCESGAVDCSAMADWGLATLLGDLGFIRQQIELVYPGKKPIVAGLSLGSILALAAINANPSDYKGAILIDGTIYDEDLRSAL
jgi:pimeloyl-ACP methyl ester carboxylesterase